MPMAPKLNVKKIISVGLALKLQGRIPSIRALTVKPDFRFEMRRLQAFMLQ